MSEEKQDIEATLGIGKTARRRWPWRVLAFAAAIVVGALIYLQFFGTGTTAPVYTTQPATRGDLVVTVTATGSVEPTNMVDISSELSGRITEVLVDFNDPVAAGQELALLDTTNLKAQIALQKASLRAAKATLARAEVTLNEARTNHETTVTLDRRGATSRQALTTATATLDRAMAEVELANADVDLAVANLGLAEGELAKACICSPIGGVVLDRQADAGQIVAASLSAPVLFTIAEDLTKMELQVSVDEADIGRLASGNRAVFTVDAYDDRTFPAEIAKVRFASRTVEGVVTYLATLSLDNSDLALRPGMTATAEIVVNEVKAALLVPNAALRFRPQVAATGTEGRQGGGLLGLIAPDDPRDKVISGAQNAVWVLREGTAVEVQIEPGDTDGKFTEIRGGALAEGDLVILREEG